MRRNGFTLTELISVLFVMFVLLAFLVPSGRHPPLKGRVTAAMANAKSIHTALFEYSMMNNVTSNSEEWPRYGTTEVSNSQFQTSTELFIHIVTQGTMNVSFSWFAPYGVTPTTGDYTTFSATNNGWCVVGNVDDDYPEDAPMIFSKNLVNVSSMDARVFPEGKMVSRKFLPKDRKAPFDGREAFVFITKGGAGFGLYGELLKYKAFTNLFQQTTTNGVRLTNPILRP